MTVNSLGYQNLTDGGTPRIITGYAKEVISGGQLLGASGAAGVVSSGLSSFASSDIELFHIVDVTDGASSPNFVGVALQTVASGAPLSFATRGSFLLQVSGANVLAGHKIAAMGESLVGDLAISESGAFGAIGRAWTCGSEDDFIVADIHG
jgi:hypothetical protein